MEVQQKFLALYVSQALPSNHFQTRNLNSNSIVQKQNTYVALLMTLLRTIQTSPISNKSRQRWHMCIFNRRFFQQKWLYKFIFQHGKLVKNGSLRATLFLTIHLSNNQINLTGVKRMKSSRYVLVQTNLFFTIHFTFLLLLRAIQIIRDTFWHFSDHVTFYF